MANAPQHGMVWPNGQCVLALGLQFFGVVQHLILAKLGANAQAGCQCRVKAPLATGQVVVMDIGIRRWMLAIGSNKEQRMKNLRAAVGIQRGGDLTDGAKVVVNKAAQSDVVFYCRIATLAANK